MPAKFIAACDNPQGVGQAILPQAPRHMLRPQAYACDVRSATLERILGALECSGATPSDENAHQNPYQALSIRHLVRHSRSRLEQSICENRMLHRGGLGSARHHQACAPVQRTGALTRASRPRSAANKIRCPQHRLHAAACIRRGWRGAIHDTQRGVRQRDILDLWFGAIEWPKMWAMSSPRSLSVARSSMSSTKEDQPWSRET